MDSVIEITFLADKTQLEKELAESFDKKFALVLNVPPLDVRTNEIFCSMKDYVENYTRLVAGEEDDGDSDEDEDGLPWHMIARKKKQVLDKIREMADHAGKNKHLENQVQFFITPNNNKQSVWNYSVYQVGLLLKDNVGQLPVAPTGLTMQIETTRGAKRPKMSTYAIQLKWDYENLGYPYTFLVEYRPIDDPEASWKQQKTSKPGETQLTIHLRQDSVFVIRVVAETCIGRSDFSEVVDTESVLDVTPLIDTVDCGQRIDSTVIEELKVLRELATNMTKDLNETKSTLIDLLNDKINEKMKENTKCLTTMSQRVHGMEAIISKMNKKLDETAVETKRKFMEMSVAIDRKARASRRLLQGKAKVAMENKWFDTIKGRDLKLEKIKDLIFNGADVNVQDNEGRAALHLLCWNFNNESLINVVRLLIQNQAYVNAKDSYGSTPIHFLCQNYKKQNLIDVVLLFVENGSDVNAKSNGGKAALHWLCENYKEENLIDVVRLLIENQADVNAKDKNGSTPIHYLCQNYKKINLIGVVQLFLDNGVDVNAKGAGGKAALHWLCENYKEENLIDVVRLLIKKGANVNEKNNNGQLPQDLIRSCYKKGSMNKILKLLDGAMADV